VECGAYSSGVSGKGKNNLLSALCDSACPVKCLPRAMLLAFHCTGAFPWESSLLVKTNSVEYSKVYTYFIGAKQFNWGGETPIRYPSPFENPTSQSEVLSQMPRV